MKVLLLNGSPKETGCTFTALSEIAKALAEDGIEAEIVHAVDSSMEQVKILAGKLKEADGLIVGSPVYYASPSGEILSVMDKLAGIGKKDMAFKPTAAIASARRAGTTATIDVLLKYFTINQMMVVSSDYWPMVHGNTPAEVREDAEGLHVMRTLGHNMAWLLKSIEAGKKAGISLPENEPKVNTNFIR